MEPWTYHWSEARESLRELTADGEFTLDDRGRSFTGAGLRVTPPLVFPVPERCESLFQYAACLPVEPARHLVLLMQAGAVSMGLFDAGEELSTKSFRRYVIRGNGRAQPTYLATRGKSRYGSRLRLQNAQRLIDETNEKLREWRAEYGPFEGVYYSAPVRMWPTLFAAQPGPPFDADDPLMRLPYDLPRPTTETLVRTYRRMSYGRVDPLAPGETAPESA